MLDNLNKQEKQKTKRLPMWAVTLICAVSFIPANFMMTRNIMYSMNLMTGIPAYSSVNFLYYIFIGLLYWGFFELIIMVAFRFMRINLSVRAEYVYFLRLVIASANVLIFGVRFVYLAAPFMQFFVEAVLVTIIELGAFFLFVYLLLKFKSIPVLLTGIHIKSMTNIYLGFLLLTALFNVIISVMQ